MALLSWLPKHTTTAQGHPRRVGVEIEFAGLTPEIIMPAMAEIFGGTTEPNTRFEYTLRDSGVGNFQLELDAGLLKSAGKREQKEQWDEDSLESISMDVLAQASEWLVPWEIVSPPLPFDTLPKMAELVESLREKGALGTRHSMVYAFGVHLNPELPDTEATTILNYFRAYLCLYDWIAKQERIDLARKLTFYIKHFELEYIEHVINPHYRPDQQQLINDYLTYNPTRNRSLDLLPLFAHLDETQVRHEVDDPRIKARPTFHYRLPNCDIDNPKWNLDVPWGLWLEVEALANNSKKLIEVCDAFQQNLERITQNFDNRWLRFLEHEVVSRHGE